jgi:FkbM family methyltransferase
LCRERWGDRSLVTLEYGERKHSIRLGSTDPLVWFSVFVQEDYGATLPFEPQVIVDAGAYTGFSAIFFANKYPAAEIIAVEPDPENFKLLTRNIRGYPRITPLQAAIWFEDTDLDLYSQTEGHWASSLFSSSPRAEQSAMHRVRAIQIESLMSRFSLDRIDLLKIDIEGAEKELFEHAAPWIDRVGAIFIELHDRFRPGCSHALKSATGGFEHRVVAPMTSLLVNRSRRS